MNDVNGGHGDVAMHRQDGGHPGGAKPRSQGVPCFFLRRDRGTRLRYSRPYPRFDRRRGRPAAAAASAPPASETSSWPLRRSAVPSSFSSHSVELPSTRPHGRRDRGCPDPSAAARRCSASMRDRFHPGRRSWESRSSLRGRGRSPPATSTGASRQRPRLLGLATTTRARSSPLARGVTGRQSPLST